MIPLLWLTCTMDIPGGETGLQRCVESQYFKTATAEFITSIFMQTKNNPFQILTWLLMAIGCCLVLWWLKAVLMPFILASVVAYLLLPAVLYLSGEKTFSSGKRLRVPRLLAAVLIEVMFFLIICALIFLIGPALVKEWPLLREQLPDLIQQLGQYLAPYLKDAGLPAHFDKEGFDSFLKQNFEFSSGGNLSSVLSSVKLGGSIALTVVGNAVLIPVVLFYLLLEGEIFYENCLEWMPKPLRPSVDSFMHESNLMLGQYLRGQVSVMLILAVYYSAALSLFGFELAFPIGIFTGLVIFIPYLGFGIGLVLALLSCILQFGFAQAIFVVSIVYGLGQVLEGFFLTPKLVGERIGLHPLGLIFALLAFGQLLGFVGVLVALPVSTVTLVALKRIKAKYLASDVYTG